MTGPALDERPRTTAPDRSREPAGSAPPYGWRQRAGWIIAPAALLLTLVLPPPEGLSVAGWRTAGAAAVMAALWIAESIPIPATALLPLVLFPALGIADIRSALVAGVILSSGLVSMWVSNTATTLMMLPIALSVVELFPRDGAASRQLHDFGAALLLAVAYGATSGGMATLIGTPPNALLAAYMSEVYDVTIGFAQWMLTGVPISAVTLACVYVVLTRVMFRLVPGELPGMARLIADERARLGPLQGGELAVAVVSVLTAAGWTFQPLVARVFPLVSDTTIAMAGALVLFVIPAKSRPGGACCCSSAAA